MNRTISSSVHTTFAAVAIAAAGAFATGTSYADDITIDTMPAVLSASAAAVKAEARQRPASDEWTLQHNEVMLQHSGLTAAQAKADYVASRSEVMALNAEDSGSSYFGKLRRSMTTAMAAPTR
jgi:hypothetical protein